LHLEEIQVITLHQLLHCPFSEGHLKPWINATSQKYPIPTKIRDTKFKNKKIGIFTFKVRPRLRDPLRHQPNDPLTCQSLQTMAAQHAQRNTFYILNQKICVGIQLRQKIVVLPLELPDCQKTILRLLKVDMSCKKKNNQIRQYISRLQWKPKGKLNGKFASSNPKMAYHFFCQQSC
jgi:hypothetical protein